MLCSLGGAHLHIHSTCCAHWVELTCTFIALQGSLSVPYTNPNAFPSTAYQLPGHSSPVTSTSASGTCSIGSLFHMTGVFCFNKSRNTYLHRATAVAGRPVVSTTYIDIHTHRVMAVVGRPLVGSNSRNTHIPTHTQSAGSSGEASGWY